MDINRTEAGSTNDSINQVIGLKKQAVQDRVSLSMQKKKATVEININKNLLENRTASNKGSKLNVFA